MGKQAVAQASRVEFDLNVFKILSSEGLVPRGPPPPRHPCLRTGSGTVPGPLDAAHHQRQLQLPWLQFELVAAALAVEPADRV